MSTFAQLQKLKPVQQELVPLSKTQKKKKEVRTKKRNKKQSRLNIENIFKLPIEIIDHIIINEDLQRYLLNLRVINKEVLRYVDEFCRNQCKIFLFGDEVNPVKLYLTKISFHNYIPRENNIFYSKDDKCTMCNRNGFFNKYNMCAFGCRKYYCQNRNCEEFSGHYFVDDIKETPKCFECGKKMVLSIKGCDRKRCRQKDYNASEYAKCIQFTTYSTTPAYFACGDCRDNYYSMSDSDDF